MKRQRKLQNHAAAVTGAQVLEGKAPSHADTHQKFLNEIRDGDQSWRETIVDRYIAFLGGHVVNCDMRIATLRQIPGSQSTQVKIATAKAQYLKAIEFLRTQQAGIVARGLKISDEPGLEIMELRLRANAWLQEQVQ